MSEWDNEDRAAAAGAAVVAFQAATGTDIEDAAADLIADLLHWVERNGTGQDALKQVRRGIRMYLDEKDYPPEGWAPDEKMAHVEINTWRAPL